MTPDETLAEVAKHVAVLRKARKGGWMVVGPAKAIDALIALVPEPEPEWPDEVVQTVIRSTVSSDFPDVDDHRPWAVMHLNNLHKAGLDITLREQP